MRKLKDKSKKGKKNEKDFALKLKLIFPSAETEIKPRIINLKKDFWGIFDGLTFIKSKKKYIFWQLKNKKISLTEFKAFWHKAYFFGNQNIIILLIEMLNNEFKIFFSSNRKKYLTKIKDLKKII
ncbi:MAG: hypothetical protein KatS3mg095_0767 [Candidatus Parcubacteria bacterium]|nr:MAG: hypothetical protein KatS3mg095_0767 [Candidatus Parcubacteria bacterium]